MKRLTIFALSLLFTSAMFAQITKPGEMITEVPTIDKKVVFLKEVAIDFDKIEDTPYKVLRKWVSDNYSKDHFHSSIRYDDKNSEAIVKSRVELILPPNQYELRETVVMRYRINCFIYRNKAIFEIIDIAFIYDAFKNNSKYSSRVVDADEIISDRALNINDELKEIRANTRKSALFFINQLANELELRFGHEGFYKNRPKALDIRSQETTAPL